MLNHHMENSVHNLKFMPFQGRFVVGEPGLAIVKLFTKFKICTFTDYEDMKGEKNTNSTGNYRHRSLTLYLTRPRDLN